MIYVFYQISSCSKINLMIYFTFYPGKETTSIMAIFKKYLNNFPCFVKYHWVIYNFENFCKTNPGPNSPVIYTPCNINGHNSVDSNII